MNTTSAGAHKQRVLFIGLDGGDAEKIDTWCMEGKLPTISKIRSQGTWARMGTTSDTVHVSSWASAFTGTTPDKHGLYHALVMQPGHQTPVRPRPDQSPFPFFWKLLSDSGKRSVVMDAFMTSPLQDFNGIQILEWGSWTWFWEPTILPASFKGEIQQRFGTYPAENHHQIGMEPPDCKSLYQRLLAAVAHKADVVRWLMEQEDWELFLVVFGELHPAGHYFWHFQDADHVAYPQDGEGELHESALSDVYIAMDKAIGKIVEGVGEDTTVFIVSGDGIGPNHSGSHILQDLLTRMGLLNNMNADTPDEGEGSSGTEKKRRGKSDALQMIRNMIPQNLRAFISRKLLPKSVNEKLYLRWKTSGISWEHTRAFLIDNANEGYIRINLKGREPQGIVEQGKEYEALCEELYQTMKSMTNPATGLRAALAVHKTDDLYTGPCRDQMPDIIINWNENAKVTNELATDKYGVARSTEAPHGVSPFYTGNHRSDAFIAAMGPTIHSGTRLEGAHILDLAPTILSLLGLTPPEYMDGKVFEPLNLKKG